MWKYWKLSFCLLFLSTCPIAAQETLTPEAAVEEALRNNHDIIIARVDKETVKQNVYIGNAGMLPTIDVTATEQHAIEDTRLQFIDGDVVDRDNAASRTRSVGALLNWTLFDGMSMFWQYDRLKELDVLEEYRMKETIENTVQQVLNAYNNLVLQQQLLNAYSEAADIALQKLRLSEDRLEAGVAPRAEVLQARVDYNLQRSNMLRQKTEMRSGKIELNRLMGVEDAEYGIEHDYRFEDRLTLENLVDEMTGRNKSLLQAAVNRNLATIDKKISNSLFFPTIGLYAGYSLTTADSEANIITFRQAGGWNYGITAAWRIFDGFNQSRQNQIARIRETQSQNLFNMTRHNLNSEVTNGYTVYENNLLILELEEENILIAQENLELAMERFEAGAISAFELREAELSYNEVNNRLASARFEVKTAELELKRLSGRILEDKE
ncbi:TolC family protein [Cytophagaceae bacterium ABcell3]|nr:TolC family protein [Cytophagaceae bacterium ABcell3]